MISGREQVPVLDDAGQPILKKNGEPRTKTVVHRELQTTFTWNGLANFARAFRDEEVKNAVRVTATFVIAGVTIEVAFGLFLAWLFNRRLLARPVLRSVMVLPIFATPIAVGYLFFTIFYEVGGPLEFMGVPWLSDGRWALFSIILVDVWQWTPFCFLVFLAALQGIPEELVEQARLDTSSEWDLWRMVILPMLQPIIILVVLLRLAEAFKLFDIVATLTKGGPGIATQSYSYLAFTRGFKLNDFGYASAMAYLLLIVVMIVVTIFFRRLRRSYE
ncbi:MAG: sugar ABC transporter permease [Rhizobiales bacterium]|nr:sugar ABC transporter permease [Hyphomicrobiales bacterium]